MAQWLKQSTAVTLKIGPFLDEDDQKTAETGLTITQADVRLSKNGANIAQKAETTACTHDELGIYGCPIDATDTDTLGRLVLWVHESGASPVRHEYTVIPAGIYNSLIAYTALISVDTWAIEGEDATDQLRDAVLDTGIGGTVWTYTLTSTEAGTPAIEDARVWVTSDEAGTTVLASGYTDASGEIIFYLDTGTVYVWRQKGGYNFTNPDTETVS